MSSKRLDRTIFAALLLGVTTLCGLPSAAVTQSGDKPVASDAIQALMVDGATGTVLFRKNPDAAFPPASLAKMMTMEIVFGAIEDGQIGLDTEYPISEHAWRTGGAPSRTSTMFAKLNSTVPVAALIRGTIVQSANDAAIALAEGLSGSEAAFAERMNQRAAELGMSGSHFVNPTGLPADGQEVTTRDLVKLARHIRNTYPELYKIYAEPAFEWNKIFQRNRNPLLSMDLGADGMETGYTEASGFALVGVTEAGGRETFLAMSGLESARQRSEEARKLLTYARDGFTTEKLFDAGALVGTAAVFGGEAASVPLTVRETTTALVPEGSRDRIKAQIRYDGPLMAPLAQDQKVATLDVTIDGQSVYSQDLYTARAVGVGGFTELAAGALKELALGWLRAL